MLPRAPRSCAGSVMGIPRRTWQWGHSRGDPSGSQSPAGPSVPALREQHPTPCPPPPGNAPLQPGNSPCQSFSPLQLPGDACIDTAERKIRHSEELRFSPFYRPDGALHGTKSPGHFGAATTPGSGIRDQCGASSLSQAGHLGRDTSSSPQAESQAGSLKISFPSRDKAPGRSEHSGGAAATLRTLGSSLEHPTPRNPRCRSSNPKHIVSRWECLWNIFSTLQDPALEQNVASLQWESFHHHHPSSGTSRGESYSCCKNSDRPSVFIIFHLLCTIQI